MDDSRENLGVLIRDVRTSIRALKGFGVRFVECHRTDLLSDSEAPKAHKTDKKKTISRTSDGEEKYGFGDARKLKWKQSIKAKERQPSNLPCQTKRQGHFFKASETNASGSESIGKIRRPNPLSKREAQVELDRLREEIGLCTRCALSDERKNIVFGEGNPKSQLVLVGEGPGREEDLTGRPFVGKAGQLLDRILAAMGYRREDVYICNVVKCRPPNNRVPQDDEMRTCGVFLVRQLEVIRPRHILALGATAVKYLLGTSQSMSKLRGRFFDHASGAKIVPTYHPAYLLRNPAAKKLVWEDVQKVINEVDRSMENLEP